MCGKRLTDMGRPNAILTHPLYAQEYALLQRLEKGRIFCCHDLTHFLDVARACWILTLEKELPLKKDVVYAAGLLHDIGKGRQYADGTPHHLASASLAQTIMGDCGYTSEEISQVVLAIRLHRKPSETEAPLAKLLYEADKKTRLCFQCPAQQECNWGEEKKNRSILY